MRLRTASVPFESMPTFQANLSEPKQYGVIGYRQTSATAGTVFQDTRKPLKTWFRGMWYVTSQKNGASALGLQRVLWLRSYQTAWAWLHKLRRAMVRSGRDHLSGWIEVDETYIGGWEEGMKGRRRGEKSLIVIAAQAGETSSGASACG
jgi:hypothetical protein